MREIADPATNIELKYIKINKNKRGSIVTKSRGTLQKRFKNVKNIRRSAPFSEGKTIYKLPDPAFGTGFVTNNELKKNERP